MKKYFLVLVLVLISTLNMMGQIPSADKLRKLGASEEQINQAMEAVKKQDEQKTIDSLIISDNTDTLKAPAIEKEDIEENVIEKFKIESEKSNIYGQDIFKNNNIKFYTKASEVIAPDNYVLGTGDEISISVWGFSDYNQIFTINESGFISPKLIGRIYLKGLTFKVAKSLIKQKLAQILDLDNSQVDITLSYTRVITVNIVGDVLNPGSYTIPAINTAFNALVTASGPNEIGSIRNIFIKREGKTVDTLDTYKFLMDPSYNYDIFLQNNDYLFVPTTKKVVKIVGQIKRPHNYELTEKENLKALLYYAGGLNASAYTANIQIKRYKENKKEYLIDLNLDSLIRNKGDFQLMDGDLITINDVPSGLENSVAIEGAIKIPGSYELKEGDRVSDLIKRAEGPLFEAYLDRGFIIRLKNDLSKLYIPININNILLNEASPDNIHLERFDIIKIISKKDFTESSGITVFGAVNKPGSFVYGSNLVLKDALFLSGGLKSSAANNRIEISRVVHFSESENRIIPIRTLINTVEINGTLNLSKEAENFKLEPFDQIFVRTNPDFELQNNITIQGEVIYPGEYTLLHKDEKIADVIERAGGLTPYAFKEGANVFRTTNNTGVIYTNFEKALKKETSKHNLILLKGDQIIIPKVVDIVHIQGNIGNVNLESISTPYFGGRAKFYIRSFAGGFGDSTIRRKTYVTNVNGIAKKTHNFVLFKIYPKVEKGSTIYLVKKVSKTKKEREPMDWNKAIEGTTVKLTGIITLLLLLKAAGISL